MSDARAGLIGAHAATREATAAPQPQYEGLVTRTIAFALDAALINVVAIVVGVGVGLVLSVVPVDNGVDAVLLAVGGVSFVIWTCAYFVTFWAATGQTPGNRVMRIRVCRAADGGVLKPHESVVRMGALVLAALPLFAGFLPILVDDRRRGLHDMIARTVVVGSAPPGDPTADVRRR